MQRTSWVSTISPLAAGALAACSGASAAPSADGAVGVSSAALTAGACARDGDARGWAERCVGPSLLLPTGQDITPLAAPGSTFQHLNPALAPPFEDSVVGQLMRPRRPPRRG